VRELFVRAYYDQQISFLKFDAKSLQAIQDLSHFWRVDFGSDISTAECANSS